MIIERGDSRLGLPWNSPQAGSLTASTESRTNYVAAMDAKEKLLDIAAQILGGAPGDYDLGNENVVARPIRRNRSAMQQAAQKAIELGGTFSGKEVPADINPVTKDGVGDDRRHRPDRRRQGQPAADRRDAGPDRDLRRDRARHETGKIKIVDMLCVADCGTVLHPQGLGAPDPRRQRDGHRPGAAGAARLRPEARHSRRTVLLYQAKLPTYLDVPVEIGWGAVEKPDPQNPVGVKGVGEPPQGSGAAAITTAIADALGGHLFNRTPVSTDMILNALSKRPQAHKPLQINSV